MISSLLSKVIRKSNNNSHFKKAEISTFLKYLKTNRKSCWLILAVFDIPSLWNQLRIIKGYVCVSLSLFSHCVKVESIYLSRVSNLSVSFKDKFVENISKEREEASCLLLHDMWPSVAVSDFPLGATYWGVTLWIWVVLLQQEGARAELSCGICPSVSKLSLLWTNNSYCVHCLCWDPAALETFERPCPSLLAQKDRPCHCCSFSPDHYWVCAETLSDITQPEQTASFIEKPQPSPAISVISFRSGSSVLSRFHSLLSWGRGCRGPPL